MRLPRRSPDPRWLLTVLLTGQAMASLDGSIANVALPSIAHGLDASGAEVQLAVAGYLLAYAVLLVTGARLGDSRGHRATFIGGLAGFTAASLVCGTSTTIWILVVARIIQGAAAAVMVPQVLSLIQRSVDGAARARALSYYSAILALGVAAGQVLGGALVTANLAGSAWRSVFLVNVPVGAVLLRAAWRHLPETRAEACTFDVRGMLVLSAAMALLVVSLVLGREWDWPAWSLACLALAASAFAGFVRVERAAMRRGREPLIDLALLRDRVVAFGLVAVVVVMAGYAAFVFTFTFYLQTGLGYSPLRSGLTFLPYALGFGVASLSWRRLPGRWQRWVAPTGFAVLAAALALVPLSLTSGVGRSIVAPLLFLGGAGHAAAFAPLAVTVTARARSHQASSLSGLLSTGTTLAAVLGVVVGGGAFFSATRSGGSQRGIQLVTAGLAAVMLLAAVAVTGVTARESGEMVGKVA